MVGGTVVVGGIFAVVTGAVDLGMVFPRVVGTVVVRGTVVVGSTTVVGGRVISPTVTSSGVMGRTVVLVLLIVGATGVVTAEGIGWVLDTVDAGAGTSSPLPDALPLLPAPPPHVSRPHVPSSSSVGEDSEEEANN